MNKTLGIIVVAVLLIGGGIYFATKGPATVDMENGDANVGDDIVESEIREFTVQGSGFSFAPSTMRVRKGDIVRVTFKNTGGIHDFVIDEFNARTKQIASGAEETIEFVADQAGTFEYYCSVGDHRAKGMVGTITVEE
ncbi:MAG: cupredoxin domain-containing protein [Patescibacteria group bacterium]